MSQPLSTVHPRISYSQPFRAGLARIKSYSNFIQPLVDSFKTISVLSYDILNCKSLPTNPLSFVNLWELDCLIVAFATGDAQTKGDGVSNASWLINLSQFCGHLYKRYGHRIDVAPTLQFIQNQTIKENIAHLMVCPCHPQPPHLQPCGTDRILDSLRSASKINWNSYP